MTYHIMIQILGDLKWLLSNLCFCSAPIWSSLA